MRIAFFGQSGPYAPVVLRQLLRQPALCQIALVVEGRKLPVAGQTHRFRQPAGQLASPASEHLAGLALAAGVPALETCDVNAPEVVRRVASMGVDWLICVGFDRLFGAALLAQARLGGINAHPSRLPQLRGPSPLFWLLKQGCTSAHVTLHRLDAQEDHGPILAQQPFTLAPRATGEQLYRGAGQVAAAMLVEVLEQARGGAPLLGQPQDHSQATRAPRPTAADAEVEPAAWQAEALLNFACGAPFFCTPWMQLGSEVFVIERGLHADVGRRLPAHYVQTGTRVAVQASDGIAWLQARLWQSAAAL